MSPMRRHLLVAGAASAILLGGTLGGGVAFAATGGPTGPPATAAHNTKTSRKARLAAHRRAVLTHRELHQGVMGKVVSDSSTGGLFGHGQLVVSQPDGADFTASLSDRTHAYKVTGLGQRIVREDPAALSANEVVIVHVVQVANGSYWASTVRDSGFAA